MAHNSAINASQPVLLLQDVHTGIKTADIADTAFVGPTAPGRYRVSVYLVTSALDVTAGAVTAKIKFTDNYAAQTVNVGPVLLTTLGAFAETVIFVPLFSGSITYGTTHTGLFGVASYDVFTTCERVS